MAGRQHRIEKKNFGFRDVRRLARIITDGTKSFGIAIKSDVADIRVGSKPQNSIKHAKTGAKNWNENDGLRENDTGAGRERRFDFDRGGGPGSRCFGEKENGNLLEMTTKHVRRSGFRAQNCESARDNRMIDDLNNAHQCECAFSRIRTGEAGMRSSTIFCAPS